MVFCCEGGQTDAINCRFSVNLVCTSALLSQYNVWQGRKCGVQGNEAVNINVSDYFVHSDEWLSALPWSLIIIIILLVNQNKGERNWLKVRGDHWKTGLFAIGLIPWMRLNCCGKFSVFRQPFSSPVLYPVIQSCYKAGSAVQVAEAVDITVWILLYFSLYDWAIWLELKLLLSYSLGLEKIGVKCNLIKTRYWIRTWTSYLIIKHSIKQFIS